MRLGIDLTACWRQRVGMVTFALGLTEALLEGPDEHSFALFCSRERPPGLVVPPAAERRLGTVLSPHRHEVRNKLQWLPTVEAEVGADVMLYPYWPAPPRRRPQAPPAITMVHDLAYRVRPDEVPWQQRLYLGSLLPGALRRSAAVLAPSEATRLDVLDAYPVRGLEQRLHVVSEGPGIGATDHSPLPDGLEPGFLLVVGTIEPRKNLPRLLAAHQRLRARRPVPPLVVAGRVGWAYGDALDLLRADPAVHLLGHVDDATLATLYRSASLLAFPSLYEGFGLPLLEAMLAGLPALIGDAGSLPELAGGAALQVDPLDADSIAGGLDRLLDDQALRRRLRARGRRRAAAYTWRAVADRVLETAESAVSSRR